MPHRSRQPISARHAFALAFDLAARRDRLHSIVVPLLLRSPWIFAPTVIEYSFPRLERSQMLLVTAAAMLLDFVLFVVVTSMLRFRARSVFNTPPEAHPAPVLKCYSQGLRRVPALYLAEALRNGALGVPLGLVFVPSFYLSDVPRLLMQVVIMVALAAPLLYVGFKISMVTEVVVLRPSDPIRATERSFRLTEGRFERWLEMIAISVFLVVPIWFLMVVGFLAVAGSSWNTWLAVGTFLTVMILPVTQYAWTFFYLRLEEIDPADSAPMAGTAVEPAGAPVAVRREGSAQTKLRLVEFRPEPAEDERDS
jgi:hypothetical protein